VEVCYNILHSHMCSEETEERADDSNTKISENYNDLPPSGSNQYPMILACSQNWWH
jgi:hypothetical protein